MAMRVRTRKKRIWVGLTQRKTPAKCSRSLRLIKESAQGQEQEDKSTSRPRFETQLRTWDTPRREGSEPAAPEHILSGIPAFLCPTPRWRNGDACTTRVLRRFLPDAYTDTESLFRR